MIPAAPVSRTSDIMSCNGWHHGADCTCGWGGVFHGSGCRDGEAASHWQRASSYTNPNWHCPSCGRPVYFYQSPYGGRVYFDDLGPPWPKHSCTDINRAGQPHAQVKENKLARKELGWRPFYCTELHAHPSESGGIVLVSQNDMGVAKLFALFDKKLVDHRTPFFIRKDLSCADAYEIATLNSLDVHPYEVRFSASTSMPHAKTNNKHKPTDSVCDREADNITVTSQVNRTDILSLLLVGSQIERETFVQTCSMTAWRHGRYRPILKLCRDVFGDATISQLVLVYKNENSGATFDANCPTKHFMLVMSRALASNVRRDDEAEARVALILQSILELEASQELEKIERTQAFYGTVADEASATMVDVEATHESPKPPSVFYKEKRKFVKRVQETQATLKNATSDIRHVLPKGDISNESAHPATAIKIALQKWLEKQGN